MRVRLTEHRAMQADASYSSAIPIFDLLEWLESLVDITILAPTNKAIEELEDFGFDFNAVDPIVVQALLTYHVLDGTFEADSFSTIPRIISTLLQPPLVTNVTGGAVAKAYIEDGDAVFESGLQKTAKTVQDDIAFDGGLVHAIDSTLIFPHNVSVTSAVAGLTSFLGAVETAGMVTSIESLADVTIFIPTNEAFKSIRHSDSAKDIGKLVSTLEYHVVPSAVVYSSNLSSSLTTLQGSKLEISTAGDGSIFVNGAKIVTPDLLIYGGVAHVIDEVLMPRDSNASNKCGVADRHDRVSSLLFGDFKIVFWLAMLGLSLVIFRMGSKFAGRLRGLQASHRSGLRADKMSSLEQGRLGLPYGTFGVDKRTGS
ncbi:MAG: hypothetical protein Q9227_009025 [Pyrenula ochraceoflavens]